MEPEGWVPYGCPACGRRIRRPLADHQPGCPVLTQLMILACALALYPDLIPRRCG